MVPHQVPHDRREEADLTRTHSPLERTAGRAAPGDARPKVLAVVDYYTPGFRAGGPIRAVANLISALGSEYSFFVLTRDRDLGQTNSYDSVLLDDWLEHGRGRVFYGTPASLTMDGIRRTINAVTPDVIYLNSFFSRLSIRTLINRWLKRLPPAAIVIAPRGEFADSALRKNGMAKKLYLALAATASLLRGVIWQASSRYEEADIRRVVSRLGDSDPCVVVTREFPTSLDAPLHCGPKVAGELRLVFLSRVCRIKNLHGALRILQAVRGQVSFDVYGPIEDAEYWKECQRLIRRLPENIQVRYRGAVAPDCVVGVLAEHDVLFLPTHGENFGHAIVEALAAGVPVLISDRTPWRDLTAHSAGWDLPLDNDADFAAVLESLLPLDESAFKHLRQEARCYAGKVAATTDVLEENSALFQRALATRELRSQDAGSLRA